MKNMENVTELILWFVVFTWNGNQSFRSNTLQLAAKQKKNQSVVTISIERRKIALVRYVEMGTRSSGFSFHVFCALISISRKRGAGENNAHQFCIFKIYLLKYESQFFSINYFIHSTKNAAASMCVSDGCCYVCTLRDPAQRIVCSLLINLLFYS